MIWDAGGVSYPQQSNCNSTGTENCKNPTNIFLSAIYAGGSQSTFATVLKLETVVYLAYSLSKYDKCILVHVHFLSTINAYWCIVLGGHCQLWHNNRVVAHLE